MQMERIRGGIDGETGNIVDMKAYKLYESASVKVRSSHSLATHIGRRDR